MTCNKPTLSPMTILSYQLHALCTGRFMSNRFSKFTSNIVKTDISYSINNIMIYTSTHASTITGYLSVMYLYNDIGSIHIWKTAHALSIMRSIDIKLKLTV